MRFALFAPLLIALSGCAFGPLVVATTTEPKADNKTYEIRRSFVVYKGYDYPLDRTITKVNGVQKRVTRQVYAAGDWHVCADYWDCLFEVTVALGDAER